MPKTAHVPAYRLHKPSRQARVILHGRHVYLGPYGSQESREKYARLVSEDTASPGARPDGGRPQESVAGQYLVVELCAAFLQWADGY